MYKQRDPEWRHRVRAIRLATGLNIKEFAQALGRPYGTVHGWERYGQVPDPESQRAVERMTPVVEVSKPELLAFVQDLRMDFIRLRLTAEDPVAVQHITKVAEAKIDAIFRRFG